MSGNQARALSGSTSAPTAQGATSEQIFSPGDLSIQEDPLDVTSKMTTREKRKASASPGNDSLEADDVEVRQPNKVRIIMCSDSESEKSRRSTAQKSLHSTDEEDDLDMEVSYSSAPRRSERNRRQEDFSKLTAERQRKTDKSSNSFLKDTDMDKIDSIIEPIVSRIHKENEALVAAR